MVSVRLSVTTPRSRRTRLEPRKPSASSRRRSVAASASGTTSSRCAPRPPRLNEPAARNRPRSQAARQCDRASGQSASVGLPSPSSGSARRTASRATAGERACPSAAWPRPARSAARQQARGGSMAASSARTAWTRSRSRVSATLELCCGQALRTGATGRASGRAASSASSASVRRWGSCRWAFSGSTTPASCSRGRSGSACRSMRTGSAA